MKKLKNIIIIVILTMGLAEICSRVLGFSSYTLLTNTERDELFKAGILENEFDFQVKLLDFFRANEFGYMVYNDSSSIEELNDLRKTSPKMYYLLTNYFDKSVINEFGFRDWKKEDIKTSKTKIALVGDSFVWGIGASPVDSSFANLLRKDTTQQIFNLSVPGVDLSVYSKIVQEYIPMIKPDIVLICVYAVNDLVYYKKELKAFEYNDIFPTNIGALFKINQNYISEDSIEVFSDFHSAYLANKSIIRFNQNLLSFSAFHNMFYRTINRTVPKEKYNCIRYPKINYSKNYINRIISFCEESKCEVKFVMIPSLDKETSVMLENKLGVKVIEPKGFTENHFNMTSDGHLNNNGCLKYYQFLQHLIDTNQK